MFVYVIEYYCRVVWFFTLILVFKECFSYVWIYLLSLYNFLFFRVLVLWFFINDLFFLGINFFISENGYNDFYFLGMRELNELRCESMY